MTFQDSVLTSAGANAYGMINQSGVNPNNLTLTHSVLEQSKQLLFI